jgi:hypothetical protein
MEGTKKGKYPTISMVKNNRDITPFLYLEADTRDPSSCHVNKVAWDQKKKSSRQEIMGLKKIQEKKIYRLERLTCETHFAAATSTFIVQRG